jgi:uncharacterized protein (UPF0333 family)
MNALIEKKHKNQKGQTFIEFIFLLVILMTISLAFLKTFNYATATRWEAYLKIIARPNQNEINIK